MPAAVRMRTDFSATELRRLASKGKAANRSRRLLSLAAVLDGKSRAEVEKSVRNLTGPGMARISPRQENQLQAGKGIARVSADTALGIRPRMTHLRRSSCLLAGFRPSHERNSSTGGSKAIHLDVAA